MVTQVNQSLNAGVASSAQYNDQLFQMASRLRSLAIPALLAGGAVSLLSGGLGSATGDIEGITAAEAQWADTTFQVSTRIQELRNRLLNLVDPALQGFLRLDDVTNGWLLTLTAASAIALTLSGRLRGLAANAARAGVAATGRGAVATARAAGRGAPRVTPFVTPITPANPNAGFGPRGAPSAASQAATRVPGQPVPATGGGGIAAGLARGAGIAGFGLPFILEYLGQDDPNFKSVLKEGVRSILDPFGSFSTPQGFPGSLYLNDPPAPDTGFRPTPSGQVQSAAQVQNPDQALLQFQSQLQSMFQQPLRPQVVDNRVTNINVTTLDDPEMLARRIRELYEQGQLDGLSFGAP